MTGKHLSVAALWKRQSSAVSTASAFALILPLALAFLLVAHQGARHHHHADLGVAVERHEAAGAKDLLPRADASPFDLEPGGAARCRRSAPGRRAMPGPSDVEVRRSTIAPALVRL
jgi:hypothetical protein